MFAEYKGQLRILGNGFRPEVPAYLRLDRGADEQEFAMQSGQRRTATCQRGEPGEIICRTDRIGHPGEPVGRVFPGIGEYPLREMRGFGGFTLLGDEPDD